MPWPGITIVGAISRSGSSTKRRSAKEIAEEIEAAGGDLNAATTSETTSYYARVLASDTGLALDIFGDILSDQASMLTGSIGMLPSASLDSNSKGLYEPSHGSAPDIAGKGVANPLATILSTAMLLRYTFNKDEWAYRIEAAVKSALAQGLRTADIYEAGTKKVGTQEMGDAVVAAL